ncbi:MAG: ATP-binding protein [Candidatus Baldrarchaeia archaeon]
MNIKILRNLNPWWEDKPDIHVQLWRKQRYRWIPKWITNIPLEPFSLNFILGPRQVGKTTGIKLLITKLLEKVQPEAIIYINCEIFPDFTSLRKLLEEYLEFKRTEKIEISYIFLDEVTSLNEWWKAIKVLIDSGQVLNDIVTVTGSSSLKIKGDIELFPGRTGKGKTIEVLPLSFKKYVEIHGVKKYKLYYSEVLKLFEKYLETGGFPSSINELPVDDILNSFVGEFIRFRKSLEISKEVFASLISKIPSSMSYRAIASETSGYSYKIVQEYLEFFKNLYIIGIAYLKTDKVYYRKEKKFFFRDPLLLRLFSFWSGAKFVESAIFENVIQEHLYRKFNEIYYFKNRYEIDCIAGELKVEVKAGKPHRKYPRNVITLEREDIPEFLIKLEEEKNITK